MLQERQVTEGGNPQTGPFYINGAEPGDTLAVHFDQSSPQSQYGTNFDSNCPACPLDAQYVASDLPENGQGRLGD